MHSSRLLINLVEFLKPLYEVTEALGGGGLTNIIQPFTGCTVVTVSTSAQQLSAVWLPSSGSAEIVAC